jgi:hypothetical protein
MIMPCRPDKKSLHFPPSGPEILAATARIRGEWSPEERRRRRERAVTSQWALYGRLQSETSLIGG